MSKEIIHSLILIAVIALSFIFPKTNLIDYEYEIFAGLFVLLFLSKKILAYTSSAKSRLLESVVFTLTTLLIINTTGGTASPYFFLLFFLLFSLSLLLEPVISVTMTLTLIIFFLTTLPDNQDFKTLIPIFSLAFLTPFALFMGKEYLENQKSKIKSQKSKEDTFLFLSLVLKNHLNNIKTNLDNFMGDHELHQIKKSAKRMSQLIEEFEKEQT
ncbi:hypothetical protein GYA28_03745 [Candidatus Roizmanbacteria bacterium]|nr:hypothetical protein [Candidatus Roizmanbacteria bacterium]